MIKWLRLGVMLALACSAGWAVDWKTLHPQGCISDFAKVIDPTSKARIEAYCADLGHATGVEMALVAITSLEGEPIADVAKTIFDGWSVGQQNNGQGVLLLLAIGNRRTRVEISPALRSVLPDGLGSSILREMGPALRKQDYGDALMAAAQTLGSSVASAKHVTIQTKLPRRARPEAWESIPLALIAGGLLLAGLLFFAGAPRGFSGGGGTGFLPALWPGLFMRAKLARDCWGSRGSGGFGGFDSGDGFGGFGGGDSGGGRASSDW